MKPRRLAAFTLDVEHDYGSRTGRFEVFADVCGAARFEDFIGAARLPVSAFAVSDLLAEFPAAVDFLRRISAEVHSHSKSHNTKTGDLAVETADSLRAIRGMFPGGVIGYRAPHGALDARHLDAIAAAGYDFSASVFPSFRPGVFCNLTTGIEPFRHPNGLAELPFAVVRGIRLILSVSYVKLLGWRFFEAAIEIFGLPDVVIVDAHLHDFLDTPAYRRLAGLPRALWGVNRSRGIEYAGWLVELLRKRGYVFTTVSEIYRGVFS